LTPDVNINSITSTPKNVQILSVPSKATRHSSVKIQRLLVLYWLLSPPPTGSSSEWFFKMSWVVTHLALSKKNEHKRQNCIAQLWSFVGQPWGWDSSSAPWFSDLAVGKTHSRKVNSTGATLAKGKVSYRTGFKSWSSLC
jgi:hypothetical protein